MTIEKAILHPSPNRARAIPISALTPAQIAALGDLKKLKQEAAAEVERLIAFLDMVDGYTLSELEDADGDLEPSLGFPEPKITGDESPGFDWPYRSRDLDQRGFAGASDDREVCWPTSMRYRDRFGDALQDELEADEGEPDDAAIRMAGEGSWYPGVAEDAEDGGDDEPSLASPEQHVSTPYGGWYGAGERRDDSGNQSHWAQGAVSDVEGDEHDGREPEDEGGDGAIEDDEPSLGWTSREVAFGSYVEINGCEDLEEDAAEMGIADHDGLLEQVAGHHPGYGPAGFARSVT